MRERMAARGKDTTMKTMVADRDRAQPGLRLWLKSWWQFWRWFWLRFWFQF